MAQGYGSLDVFFGGLEALLGPPQVVKDPDHPKGQPTIRKAMENEHVSMKDSPITFTSSNGVTTDSITEWEFAYKPTRKFGQYPERKGFEEEHPEWRRHPKPLAEFLEEGGLLEVEANAKLRAEGHAEVILEEVLAGRLYTGPMYQKYNAVLRAKSGDAFLAKQCTSPPPPRHVTSIGLRQSDPSASLATYLLCFAECLCAARPPPHPRPTRADRDLCHGNNYVSTIHAINSCVIKLSKLTVAGKVWRGVCYGKLPDRFWTPSSEGICGGVEYGFQSTTRSYEQALHYAMGCGWAASDDATTLFELSMGLVDRGAELTWLSQYPHEQVHAP